MIEICENIAHENFPLCILYWSVRNRRKQDCAHDDHNQLGDPLLLKSCTPIMYCIKSGKGHLTGCGGNAFFKTGSW